MNAFVVSILTLKRTSMWNFAVLNYSSETQQVSPWHSRRSLTLHILSLTYLSCLFPTLFSHFVLHWSVFCPVIISHHLPYYPYYLCSANLSFESCMLLKGQKEVRAPYKCMAFPGSHLKWKRNNTITKLFWHSHPGHPIPGPDQILWKQHGKMKKLFRNGNSDSWEAESTPKHYTDTNDPKRPLLTKIHCEKSL